MADTPILNYKGKHDGPEIDKAVELALGLENPKSCPYYVHISLSQPDYVLTIGLGDAEGNLFNHAEIDLPLESMVVNATYENGNIILHLQDGTSTEPIPISALIAGLVSETRTIAGIDLKDDITQKELRDALDVYTKDSVDQLVSKVEESVSDLTPQVEQNKSDILTVTNTNGVKNILNYNLESIKAINSGSNWVWSDNSVTNAGITFTINSDNTITATGKLTGQLAYLRVLANFDIAQGTWTLSGCPKGGSYSTYKMYIDGISGFSDYGDTLTKTLDSPTTATFLTISIAGISDNINLLFKPMLCSSEIYNISPNYQPYSLSNAELTSLEKQNKNDILSLEENKLPFVYGYGLANSTSNVGWFKVAQCSYKATGNNILRSATFLVGGTNKSTEDEWGIIKINAIFSTTAAPSIKFIKMIGNIPISNEIDENRIVAVSKFENGTGVAEIWCRCDSSWRAYRFLLLELTPNLWTSTINVDSENVWKLNQTTTAYTNYPTDYPNKVALTDYYGNIIKELSDRITAIENK